MLSLLLGFAVVGPALMLSSLFPVSALARSQFAAAAVFPLLAIWQHVFLGPLLEEVVYRGLFLQLARRYMPMWVAVFLSSGVFGLTHFPGGWSLIVTAFAMGCVLSWIAVRSGSIYSSFLCHAALNLASGFIVAPMFGLGENLQAVAPGARMMLTGVVPAWWMALSVGLVAISVVLLAREFSRRVGIVDTGAKRLTNAN